MEYRDIVVPLDGSVLAEHAIPVAVRLSARAPGWVRLVAVVPGVGFMHPEDMPDAVTAGMRRAHQRLEAYMLDVLDRLHAIGCRRAVAEVRVGSPVEEILAVIAEQESDLIVMTSHGRGGMERAWLGSTADALIRRATVPLLVLKPEDTVEADFGARTTFHSVLVPLDGSALAESALEPAIALARLHDATLTLLQVVTTPHIISQTPYGMDLDHVEHVERRHRAEVYINGVATRLRNNGIEAATIVVEADGVADRIVELARNGAGSVIAIATHGVGGLKRLLLGSVADKVMRGADRPVLVVPPREDGARGAAQFGAASAHAD